VASFAVLVKLSETVMLIVPAVDALDDVTTALRTTESKSDPRFTKLWVRTAVAVSPVLIESVAESIVSVCDVTAAWDGTTERNPKPIAAIVATAIRLKNVLLDITFLSLVALETFSTAAGKD